MSDDHKIRVTAEAYSKYPMAVCSCGYRCSYRDASTVRADILEHLGAVGAGDRQARRAFLLHATGRRLGNAYALIMVALVALVVAMLILSAITGEG